MSFVEWRGQELVDGKSLDFKYVDNANNREARGLTSLIAVFKDPDLSQRLSFEYLGCYTDSKIDRIMDDKKINFKESNSVKN